MHPVELLSASERNAICNLMLRERLGPKGLAEIAPRRDLGADLEVTDPMLRAG